MKIRLLFVYLFMSASLGSFAQEHSSQPYDYEGTLRQLWQTAAKSSGNKPDTNQLDALYELASIYNIRYKSGRDKKNPAYLDSSLYYVKSLISSSRQAGQLDYEASANLIWGQDEMASGDDFKSIVEKYLNAISLCDAYARTHSSPNDLLLETQSNAFSNIGYVYFLNKEYDNALKYCDEAIAHAFPTYNKALPLLYKGRVYMAERNYPYAEAYLHQALAILQQQPINLRWEAMDYLAQLLVEKGQPDSAISMVRQAITGDKKALYTDMHYYWMGQAYLRKEATASRTTPMDSVLTYGRLELALGERLPKSQDRLWAYELLYKAYEPSSDKAAELKYYKQWVELSDSLGAIQHGKDIAEIQHKYDYQRVQVEADHQKFLQDQRLQQRTRYFLFTFLGLLSLTAALLAFYLVKMRRKNIELERKNKEILDARFQGQHFERKRIASELHDNLSSLLAATKLTIQVLDPSALSAGEQKIYHSVLDMMDTACREVRYISHNMMPVNIEKQGLSIALESLVAKLNQTGIILFELTNFDPRLALDKMTSFNIYSICLELCNNILRHSKATRAAIICKAYEKELHLLITDNGKGIPDTKKDGIGIKNVNERIQSLNGTLEVQSSPEGTSFWFTIPLQEQKVPAVK